MNTTSRNPSGAPSPLGGYSQGLEIAGFSRLLFVSGQIPETAGGEVPANTKGY